MKSSGVLFERATKTLGLHPYPAPMAVLSQPYRGRPACVHCGFCESFGCEMRAKSSTLASIIPEAEATGRCEIRPDSYVRKIVSDARGRATGAVYFDAKRRYFNGPKPWCCARMVWNQRSCCCCRNPICFRKVWLTPADWSVNI